MCFYVIKRHTLIWFGKYSDEWDIVNCTIAAYLNLMYPFFQQCLAWSLTTEMMKPFTLSSSLSHRKHNYLHNTELKIFSIQYHLPSSIVIPLACIKIDFKVNNNSGVLTWYTCTHNQTSFKNWEIIVTTQLFFRVKDVHLPLGSPPDIFQEACTKLFLHVQAKNPFMYFVLVIT